MTIKKIKEIEDVELVFIGITLEIIICIVGCLILYKETYSKYIFDIIQAITAIVNLILVIVFYKSTKKSEEIQIKNNNILEWYKKYITDQYIPIVDAFFDKFDERISDIYKTKTFNDDEKRKKLDENTKIISEETMILTKACSKIVVISKDLHKQIMAELMQYQDIYCEYIERLIYLSEESKNKNYKELQEEEIKIKNSIFKSFFDFAKDINN